MIQSPSAYAKALADKLNLTPGSKRFILLGSSSETSVKEGLPIGSEKTSLSDLCDSAVNLIFKEAQIRPKAQRN